MAKPCPILSREKTEKSILATGVQLSSSSQVIDILTGVDSLTLQTDGGIFKKKLDK